MNITEDDSLRLNSPYLAAGNRVRRLRLAVVGMLAGLALALVVIFFLRRSLPPLTAAELATARVHWAASAPPNYHIEIAVSGPQPALYAVEVQEGHAVAASRNGAPLKQPRTWETWTVPGMFGTLESDVRSLEEGAQLVVRCQFHPQYGYPMRYESFRAATRHQVDWEVTQFAVR